MLNKFLLLICLLPTASYAEWKVLEVDKLYVDTGQYLYASEPFLLPNYKPEYKLDVNLNLLMFDGVMFFDNKIFSEMDNTQYRKVGWNYSIGIHFGPFFDAFFEHKSEHLLDATPTYASRYDLIGVRLYLYNRKDLGN